MPASMPRKTDSDFHMPEDILEDHDEDLQHILQEEERQEHEESQRIEKRNKLGIIELSPKGLFIAA